MAETFFSGFKRLFGEVMQAKRFERMVKEIELDERGKLTDRRARRIPTELNRKLCAKLSRQIGKLEDVELRIEPVMDHRFALVLRGEGLGEGVADTDPQQLGVEPKRAVALHPAG